MRGDVLSNIALWFINSGRDRMRKQRSRPTSLRGTARQPRRKAGGWENIFSFINSCYLAPRFGPWRAERLAQCIG